MSSYTLSSALSSYAPKFTVASPIALSASNVISVDLSAYQKTMSATTPLSIANGTISIDLTAYQKNFIVGPPLLMTETTMSSGGVDVSVPTLILDMSDRATIENLWAYQTQLSVSAPLALTASGALSINTS